MRFFISALFLILSSCFTPTAPIILNHGESVLTGAADSPSGIDPSGQTMPTGDITGWRQVFADNFSTPVPLGSFPSMVSTKWTAYSDWVPDTTGNGRYFPSKV